MRRLLRAVMFVLSVWWTSDAVSDKDWGNVVFFGAFGVYWLVMLAVDAYRDY